MPQSWTRTVSPWPNGTSNMTCPCMLNSLMSMTVPVISREVNRTGFSEQRSWWDESPKPLSKTRQHFLGKKYTETNVISVGRKRYLSSLPNLNSSLVVLIDRFHRSLFPAGLHGWYLLIANVFLFDSLWYPSYLCLCLCVFGSEMLVQTTFLRLFSFAIRCWLMMSRLRSIEDDNDALPRDGG